MITNALLTEALALTDALVAAGWCQGQMEAYDQGPDYPTHHCLAGAMAVAVEQVGGAAGLPGEGRVALHHQLLCQLSDALLIDAACQCVACRSCRITTFNDQVMTSARKVRGVVARAAARLAK